MKKTSGRSIRHAVAALALVGSVALNAQQPASAPPQPPPILRIQEFVALGNESRVRAPDYRTDAGRGRNPQRYWSMITTTYDTAPEWIDELEFRYYVLTSQQTQDNQPVFYLFSTVVRYIDIARGRNKTSTVFLHSRAIERFGAPVAAGVEILFQGNLVAGRTEVGTTRLPERWWADPEILNRPEVVRKEGYLLNRAESPWALVNIDDYEVIR